MELRVEDNDRLPTNRPLLCARRVEGSHVEFLKKLTTECPTKGSGRRYGTSSTT
jgi:hypothetical protein